MKRVELENLQSFCQLSNARQIPRLGLGVYQAAPGKETENAVLWALQAGYRHIDTATIYDNEASVGNAIRKSGIPREQIFVTTKLTEDDQGYESAIAALELSLEKMGLDYVDLYLIHSPLCGSELRTKSWKALETLVEQGKAKSIGVSNYGVHHLKELLGSNPTIRPVVNQIEVHPWLIRQDIISFCESQDIAVEAYSPLCQAVKLQDPTLAKLATKYSKSPAQILIRWSLQKGFIVIPKSAKKERIEQNADVFDFDIADGDMAVLDSMNENFVTEWDPTVAP
ncbi:aldo/keto reductase [Lobosporangium transversale]|uniref:Aldo/keto reductase n=1 Tax=Lobosporangium transversale TaxID=64571 RepID=A0A1Y2GVL3_9FUNG|nr:aldo/keto reductase [Lobosporangium transversale]ORZ26340.1 aldo/keto reductase [Lobosporangium transversale]|eukprot:XP_021884105.1 aldo/keto reductase [Lobosporangium transversale]